MSISLSVETARVSQNKPTMVTYVKELLGIKLERNS